MTYFKYYQTQARGDLKFRYRTLPLFDKAIGLICLKKNIFCYYALSLFRTVSDQSFVKALIINNGAAIKNVANGFVVAANWINSK